MPASARATLTTTPATAGERALVVGLGRSGQAVARHLLVRGMNVAAVDDAPERRSPGRGGRPRPGPGRGAQHGGAGQPGGAGRPGRPQPRGARLPPGVRPGPGRRRPGAGRGRAGLAVVDLPAGGRHRHQRQDHGHQPDRRHALGVGRAVDRRRQHRPAPERRGRRRGPQGRRGRGVVVPAGLRRVLPAGGGGVAEPGARPPRLARRRRRLRGGQGPHLGQPGAGRRGRRQRRRPGRHGPGRPRPVAPRHLRAGAGPGHVHRHQRPAAGPRRPHRRRLRPLPGHAPRPVQRPRRRRRRRWPPAPPSKGCGPPSPPSRLSRTA